MTLKHWSFDDPDTPVMGMYGKVGQDGRIYQLGWIKLDLQCQEGIGYSDWPRTWDDHVERRANSVNDLELQFNEG